MRAAAAVGSGGTSTREIRLDERCAKKNQGPIVNLSSHYAAETPKQNARPLPAQLANEWWQNTNVAVSCAPSVKLARFNSYEVRFAGSNVAPACSTAQRLCTGTGALSLDTAHSCHTSGRSVSWCQASGRSHPRTDEHGLAQRLERHTSFRGPVLAALTFPYRHEVMVIESVDLC